MRRGRRALGLAFEGVGMEEMAEQSQSGSKVGGVQIRILLRAWWREKSKDWTFVLSEPYSKWETFSRCAR